MSHHEDIFIGKSCACACVTVRWRGEEVQVAWGGPELEEQALLRVEADLEVQHLRTSARQHPRSHQLV